MIGPHIANKAEMTSTDAGSSADRTPFSTLTPDALLNALEAIGVDVDGRLMALNSYENRVYQIGLASGGFSIVKVYRPGRWTAAAIGEEHRLLAELVEAEIPVVAPLLVGEQTLNERDGFRIAVFPRQGGRAPEFDDLVTLRRMGHLLGRVHSVGARSSFAHRPTLDIETFGYRPRAVLQQGGFLPPELERAYFGTLDLALEGVARCFERAGDVTKLRLHGDCHAGNVLWTDDGPCLVDFDDSRMGPAVQDVWMLFSGDDARRREQCRAFLAGYRQFRNFDRREWHLFEALRTLRLIHYAAWVAERWNDPAFPAAFPWFETPRYWQDRVLELKEQIALMAEEPPFLDLDD